ncbi:MAG: hypothetical protein R3F61_29570 [Myxococcota bacterium]
MRIPCFALLAVGCSQDYEIVAQPPEVDPWAVTGCGFTDIEGTPVSEYDCNPVFTGTEEGWGARFESVGFHVTEVLGHPTYQLWYVAEPADGDGYGLGYATSTNGVEWTPHPDNPVVAADGGWDATSMDEIQVVWDAAIDEYVLVYQGYNLDTDVWGIGGMQSPDGVEWTSTTSAETPLLDLRTALAGRYTCWPLAFTTTSVGYQGYIAAAPGQGLEDPCEVFSWSGEALDSMGFSETPVLTPTGQPHDAMGVSSAAVVDFRGTLYLFYVGFEAWEDMGTFKRATRQTLSVATSTNGGRSWQKDPDNPLPVHRTDPGAISGVAAQVVGDRIHLWITDEYASIGRNAVGYYLYQPR